MTADAAEHPWGFPAVWGRLTRDTTRWYLHRDADVDVRLRAAGFVGQEVERTLIWHVMVDARPS